MFITTFGSISYIMVCKGINPLVMATTKATPIARLFD